MEINVTCKTCRKEFHCTDSEDGDLCPTCTAKAQRVPFGVTVVELKEVAVDTFDVVDTSDKTH